MKFLCTTALVCVREFVIYITYYSYGLCLFFCAVQHNARSISFFLSSYTIYICTFLSHLLYVVSRRSEFFLHVTLYTYVRKNLLIHNIYIYIFHIIHTFKGYGCVYHFMCVMQSVTRIYSSLLQSAGISYRAKYCIHIVILCNIYTITCVLYTRFIYIKCIYVSKTIRSLLSLSLS